MSREQLATGRVQIATTALAGTAISDSPELYRSSYQSQSNEVIGLLDRAAADIRAGWLEAAFDCLVRAVRATQAMLPQKEIKP